MIIVDSRERDISGILNYFDKNEIKYVRGKLNFGDYTTPSGNIYIERKRIGELAMNLTGTDKLRLEREFIRANKARAELIVMIEGSLRDIQSGNYRSTLSPSDFLNRLKTWQNHFMIKVEFVKKEEAGKFIYQKLSEVRNEKIHG
jgi:hypothetical protein